MAADNNPGEAPIFYSRLAVFTGIGAAKNCAVKHGPYSTLGLSTSLWLYSSTRLLSGVMVAHFTPTPLFILLLHPRVIWSSSHPFWKMEIVIIQIHIQEGKSSFSFTIFHMMRVVSSPSISTILVLTFNFAHLNNSCSV